MSLCVLWPPIVVVVGVVGVVVVVVVVVGGGGGGCWLGVPWFCLFCWLCLL